MSVYFTAGYRLFPFNPLLLNFYSLPITLRTTRFSIQKFYMVLALHLCVLYGPYSRQRLLPYTELTGWFGITDVESVYCAVRTESYKTDTFSL